MTDCDRATCAALASLLRAVAVLAHWGFMLTCIAALALALTPCAISSTTTLMFGAMVMLGLLERYFAFRLRFDAALFDGLARNTITSLDALDQALDVLGLRPTQPQPTARLLDDRVQGTKRLMRNHVIAVTCQSAVFFLALPIQRLT